MRGRGGVGGTKASCSKDWNSTLHSQDPGYARRTVNPHSLGTVFVCGHVDETRASVESVRHAVLKCGLSMVT